MATRLKDIAERVGVSTSTVSLVLNGHDHGRVNEASAATIRETAWEMGYLPNMLARGLKTRHSKMIGLLAEGVASIPFSGQMIAGAQETAWEQGYLLLVVDVGHHEEMNAAAIKALLQRDIDALILAADFPREIPVPDLPVETPVVLLGALPEPIDLGDRVVDWGMPDDEGGAYAAVNQLIAAGHRRIAFCTVSDPRYSASADARRRGYHRALQDAGLRFDESLLSYAPGPETTDGREAAQALLDRPDRPTAVFCFCDRLAMALYQAANDVGLRIPDDLSVVGFDNQAGIADSMKPGLTTVQLPHRELGVWAARTAISRIRANQAPPGVHLVASPLVIRDSVASLA